MVYLQTDVELVHDYMAAEFHFSQHGREYFRPLSVDELKMPPVWFTEEDAKAFPITEEGHVSFTKHWKQFGEDGIVEEIPIKHFFGMPSDQENYKIDPSKFPSSDGFMWRQGFRRL